MSSGGGKESMLGMLVVTHGNLARELVASARTIVGEDVALEALSIAWNDDPDGAAESIRKGIDRLDRGRGVLVLTDMFGGTPTNLSLALLEPGRVEIVTGANLPMLIRFANLDKDAELTEAAASVALQGRESVQVASELLDAQGDKGREESS